MRLPTLPSWQRLARRLATALRNGHRARARPQSGMLLCVRRSAPRRFPGTGLGTRSILLSAPTVTRLCEGLSSVNLISQSVPQQFRRRRFVASCYFLFAVAAACLVASYIIADDLKGLALVGMVSAGGAIVIAILNNWRNGLYFFLAWLLFEDFARKYLGNNMVIYFAKDVLAAAVYLSFFLAYRRKEITSFRPPFLVPVLIFAWFGVMQVFNPASTHLVYGVLGLKLFFYYVPLLFVGYALLNSEEELRRFFFLNMMLAAIIVSLGIVQAIVGHTFLNPVNLAEDIRELSGLYRTSPISGLT